MRRRDSASRRRCRELFDLNIDVMTTGNHVWDKREIIEYSRWRMAIRIARRDDCCGCQFLPEPAGLGVYEGQKDGVAYAVMNLQGRVFMLRMTIPFAMRSAAGADQGEDHICGLSCEATSEKVAFGWYLDGA